MPYLVAYTIETDEGPCIPEGDPVDQFLIVDSIEEARNLLTRAQEDDDVKYWAIAKVTEASEPQWMDGV